MSSIENIAKRLRESRLLQENQKYIDMDHSELVALAQDGDQIAIETLIKLYTPAINKISSKYILDSGDADDVKQVATIAFWDAIMSWNMKGSLGAYANMVMDRKLTDELRKDSTEKAKLNSQSARMEDPVASDDEGGESELGASIVSSELSPEDIVIGKHGEQEILRFMRERFSENERRAVMLYIQGYKVSDIATETGMKYKSIENALKRVKDKLADYLRTRESKKIKESDDADGVLCSIIEKLIRSIDEGIGFDEASL